MKVSKGNICPCCKNHTLHKVGKKIIRVFQCEECGFEGHDF